MSLPLRKVVSRIKVMNPVLRSLVTVMSPVLRWDFREVVSLMQVVSSVLQLPPRALVRASCFPVDWNNVEECPVYSGVRRGSHALGRHSVPRREFPLHDSNPCVQHRAIRLQLPHLLRHRTLPCGTLLLALERTCQLRLERPLNSLDALDLLRRAQRLAHGPRQQLFEFGVAVGEVLHSQPQTTRLLVHAHRPQNLGVGGRVEGALVHPR
mmetsp:Transcript_14915/g.34687  ORF Transcript_14915/g.34687 Transcript_14915/m.34687 type:complete len:210 (-) Transcript_14915:511-1140(-)